MYIFAKPQECTDLKLNQLERWIYTTVVSYIAKLFVVVSITHNAFDKFELKGSVGSIKVINLCSGCNSSENLRWTDNVQPRHFDGLNETKVILERSAAYPSVGADMIEIKLIKTVQKTRCGRRKVCIRCP